MATAAPSGGRYLTLDAIRGVAVMGILTMNIAGFALVEPAYLNPLASGPASTLDIAVYCINFVLFDGKMRGLFSFLFGASMLLVIERAEASGEDPAIVHYSRMLWLLVFGLIHLWFVWWGDILSHYALLGMVAYAFRGRDAAELVRYALLLLVLQWLLTAGYPVAVHQAGLAAQAPGASGEARAQWAAIEQSVGTPSHDWIAARTALFRGSYGAILAHRLAEEWDAPLETLLTVGGETLAYMFLGMAAFRAGMLTGSWPRERYRRWAALTLGPGALGFALLAFWLVEQHFSAFAVTLAVIALPLPLRTAMIVGWACLILLLLRPGGPLTARVAAAGRMAFTNYLATSLICTTLFYGYGLGWFERLSRAELVPVMLAIWAAMLLWSKPWLDRFRYGPLEWLWRSLARARLQPMRHH